MTDCLFSPGELGACRRGDKEASLCQKLRQKGKRGTRCRVVVGGREWVAVSNHGCVDISPARE